MADEQGQQYPALLPEQNLDVVPTNEMQVADIAIVSKHAPKYLIGICEKYNLTRRQLGEVISIKDQYGTNLSFLTKFLGRYDIDTIGQFLCAREGLRRDIETKKGNINDSPSVELIVQFSERFGSSGMDGDNLADMIDEARKTLEERYAHSTNFWMKMILDTAEKQGLSDVDAILDYLTITDGERSMVRDSLNEAGESGLEEITEN